MSTTTTWPLLLELSPQYVESSASQQVKAEHDVMSIKYNPLTQVTEDSTGVPRMTTTDVVGDTIIVHEPEGYTTLQHNDHLNYD